MGFFDDEPSAEAPKSAEPAASAVTEPATAPPPPVSAAANQGGIVDTVAMEAARAIAGGARGIYQGALETVTSIPDPLTAAEKAVRAVTGTSVPAGQETFKDPGAAAAETVKKTFTLPEVEANQYTVGAVSRELVKWIGGTVLLRKVPGVPTVGAGLGAKVADAAVEGVVSGYIFTDPHAQNLGNLMENVPLVGEAIKDFAGQDSNDSDAVNKLRGALENSVVGALVTPLLHAVPAVVKYAKAMAEGKTAEAEAIMDAAQPQIVKALAEAQDVPNDLSLYSKTAEADVSAAPKVAEAGASKETRTLVDSAVYQGANKGSLLQGNEQMIVARDAAGKDLGYIRVTPEEGGYKVNRIETDPAFRKQGVATMLDNEAQARYGKYLGASGQTPEGAAFRASQETKALTQGNIAMGTVDAEKLIQNIKVSRSMGQDGATQVLDGTLNYAKLGDDMAVKNMISEVVQEAKKALPDMAGTVQTKAETLELARILGKDPVDLFNSIASMRLASEDMAAHITGGKMLIQKIAKEMENDATRIISGKAELIDLAGFQMKADILASTIDHVSVLRTEAARATAAGRYKVGMGGITSENFMKVLEAAGGSEYVQKMAERLKMVGADGIPRSLLPPKTWFQKAIDIHNYLWMNAVLSGVKTTVINVGSTLVNTAAMPGFRMVGGVMQEILGAKGGMEEFYKGLHQYQLMKSQVMDSFAMAGKAWKTSASVLDSAGGQMERVMINPISDLALVQKAGMEWLGSLAGLPGRFLTTQDEFFKQITYRSHVGADAWVQGSKQGLEGNALKNFMQDAINKSTDAQGKWLNEPALLAARAAAFTQSLEAASYSSNRAWMAVANSAVQQVPVIKTIAVPFLLVPTNLFRQAWDMTPILNLARKQWLEDVKAGGEVGATALGKMGVGTALWTGAAFLAHEGRITPGGPRDADLRRQLGPDWKPYSFVTYNEDGSKNYTPFSRFDPYSHFFTIAADIHEISGKLADKDMQEIASRATMAVMQNISSKTYLRGLTDVMEAFTGDDASINKWVRSRVASYVPNLVQVLNTDDEVKDMRTWFDGFRSRIPGWSSSVEAKRDNFGEKVMTPSGYPYNAFWPFASYRGTDDPVRLELAALSRTKDEPKFPVPNPKQGPLDLREITNPETGQSAYDRWLELASVQKVGGKTLHESMGDLMNSSVYQKARARMADGDSTYKGAALAISLVRERFQLYEDQTLIQLKREFPGLGKSLTQFEIGKAITKVRGSDTATPLDQLRQTAGQQ